MTNQANKPQPGQYWRNGRGEIAFVAFDESEFTQCAYPLRVYTKSGGGAWMTETGLMYAESETDWDLAEHIPDCTGFDWTPSQAQPAKPCESDAEKIEALETAIQQTGYNLAPHLVDMIRGVIEIAKRAIQELKEYPSPFQKPFTDPRSGMGISKHELAAIDPGEGYRLVDDGEEFQETDERAYTDGGKQWCQVMHAAWNAVGMKTVGDLKVKIPTIVIRRKKPDQPEWPKWYMPNNEYEFAYVARLSETECSAVRLNGASTTRKWLPSVDDKRKQITETEALARITPQPSVTQEPIEQPPVAEAPVESPDDWVEISKAEHPQHIPRVNTDVLMFAESAVKSAENMSPVDSDNLSAIANPTWIHWKFACRRKDLPKQPLMAQQYGEQPTTKRVSVRLWVTHRLPTESGDWPVRASTGEPDLPGWNEIKSDPNGSWYVEVPQ